MTASQEKPAPPPGDAESWARMDQPSGRWMLPGTCPDVRERTLVLEAAARLLFPVVLVFSVFLLLRGHNEPGGGFVGGLVAAAAFALYSIAFGVERARRAVLVRPLTLLGAGLLVALLSGLPGVQQGRPFLSALWTTGPMAVGTPALFDIGVFLVVAGVVLMMVFSLAEEA